MSEIDVDEVQRVTRAIIRQAKEDGTLDSEEWTPLKVRREVEKRMSLETESLDAKEYKKLVKTTIELTMEENGEDEEATVAVPVKKGKTSKASKGERPRATANVTLDKKKDKKSRAPAKKAKKSSAPKRSESVIPSSDDEMRGDDGSASATKPASSAPIKRKTKTAVESDEEFEAERSPEPPKKRQKSAGEDEDVDMRDTPNAEPRLSSSTDVAEARKDKAASSEPPLMADDSGYSESEMSVLIDEPPKRTKQKNKDTDSKKKSAKQPRVRKPRQPAKELSKDEETIKRLKSLVVACGVRKQWAKEFKGMDRPSDQIRRLKQILSDLGMTGRMSLEQAKAIREKREFAQELEDVQSFEKSIVASGSRTRKNSQQAKEASEVESDEDVANKPKRPRATARQSIMAFLQDQSDDE
ncbi:hypothetical protein DAEQUDRAFT_272676 [Daedalea quercina L-15889]|uniref:DEK C-terminal domain-containing protein n=1 Tax=Daedalea quercina L-15889 TaxID=1314783 RepID=A0A165QD87_9APHY|nr:hypothetical protein DAEQUDRAFT_272676 [Daedalea quercina L-15889]